MKIIISVILNTLIRDILRAGLLLFLSIYISMGHLSQYLECFDSNDIELVENNGENSKEKENKEKIIRGVRNSSFDVVPPGRSQVSDQIPLTVNSLGWGYNTFLQRN